MRPGAHKARFDRLFDGSVTGSLLTFPPSRCAGFNRTVARFAARPSRWRPPLHSAPNSRFGLAQARHRGSAAVYGVARDFARRGGHLLAPQRDVTSRVANTGGWCTVTGGSTPSNRSISHHGVLAGCTPATTSTRAGRRSARSGCRARTTVPTSGSSTGSNQAPVDSCTTPGRTSSVTTAPARQAPRSLKTRTTSPSAMPRRVASSGWMRIGSRPCTLLARLTATDVELAVQPGARLVGDQVQRPTIGAGPASAARSSSGGPGSRRSRRTAIVGRRQLDATARCAQPVCLGIVAEGGEQRGRAAVVGQRDAAVGPELFERRYVDTAARQAAAPATRRGARATPAASGPR